MEVTFTLKNEAEKEYIKLLEKCGSSDHLLRNALATFSFIVELQEEGSRILILHKDGREEPLLNVLR